MRGEGLVKKKQRGGGIVAKTIGEQKRDCNKLEGRGNQMQKNRGGKAVAKELEEGGK